MQNRQYWETCSWAEGVRVPDPRKDSVRDLGARPGPESPSEGLGTLAQVPVSSEPWHSALHALWACPGKGATSPIWPPS